MKKTSLPLKTVLVLFTVICLFFGLNEALTAFVENSNYVLTGQEFSSPEEAMNAWEEFERKEKIALHMKVMLNWRRLHSKSRLGQER